MMTWRTIAITGALVVVATALALQAMASDPPYVIDGAPSEISFDEDGWSDVLDLTDVFADDDPEDANLTFSFFEVDGVSVYVDTTGDVNISGDEDWNGLVTVTFRAYDTGGYFAEHRVNVTVTPVNDPPEILGYIRRESWWKGEEHHIDLAPYFRDVDGDQLYYYVENVSTDAYAFQNRGDDYKDPWIEIHPVDTDFYGYIQVTFRVYDQDPSDQAGPVPCAEMRAFFEVYWEPPPEGVTLAVPNITKMYINEGESETFEVLGFRYSDPEEWTYEWKVDDVTVVENGSSVFEFPVPTTPDGAYNTSGEYRITVWCHQWWDGLDFGFRGPVWTLTVLDVNRLPVITFLTGNQTLSPGDDVNLQVIARDPDGDHLTYRWYRDTEKDIEEIGNDTRVTYTRDLSPGRHRFACEISDGNDTITTDWVTITVEEESPGSTGAMAVAVLVCLGTLHFVARRLRHQRKAY